MKRIQQNKVVTTNSTGKQIFIREYLTEKGELLEYEYLCDVPIARNHPYYAEWMTYLSKVGLGFTITPHNYVNKFS